jgi:hypothetical protein
MRQLKPDAHPRRQVLRWLGAGSLLAGGHLQDILAQGVAPARITAESARPQTAGA